MTAADIHQKATPGPWHASMTRLGTAVDIGAAGGANIAIVCGPEDNGADEFKANGRLIAAGPELIVALKAIAEFPITDRQNNQDAANLAMIARAALAKAEG